jgi:hypothetical protein
MWMKAENPADEYKWLRRIVRGAGKKNAGSRPFDRYPALQSIAKTELCVIRVISLGSGFFRFQSLHGMSPQMIN